MGARCGGNGGGEETWALRSLLNTPERKVECVGIRHTRNVPVMTSDAPVLPSNPSFPPVPGVVVSQVGKQK